MIPQVRSALQVAGTTLVVTLLLTGAQKMGVIDKDLFMRLVMALVGLVIAWSGNIAPKENPGGSGRQLALRRFSGWSIAAAGLVNAGIWLFAPMELTAELSMLPIGIAVLSIIAYCFWLRGKAARA